MIKSCGKCRISKPLEAFSNNRATRDGLSNRCRDCSNADKRESWKNPATREANRQRCLRWRRDNIDRAKANARAWRHKNRSATRKASRRNHLRRKYGLTAEAFNAVCAAQGDACAICRKPFVATPRVDHDHETGAVRGLLCNACNVAIAALGDNVEGIDRAVAYLRRSRVSLVQTGS